MIREPHCDKDYGGSHYHCGGCGEVTGMMGHWVRCTYLDGQPFEGHTCKAGVRIVWRVWRMHVEPNPAPEARP